MIKQKLKQIWNLIKTKTKKILVALGIVGVAMAAGSQIINSPEQISMPELRQVQEWQRPVTDEQWKEDIKAESLNVKHDYQLDQMQQNLNEKLPKVQKDLDKFVNCPECIKYDLRERFAQMFKDAGNPNKMEGKTLQEWIDGEFKSQYEYYQWKTAKISQSLERIGKEKELRATKKVDRTNEIVGTTYYIDAVNGLDSNDGLASSTAWKSLDQFTENARSAGDKVIIRRNTTDNGALATTTTSIASSTDAGVITDLNFTSDGTIVAPIIIEADYDNVWEDFSSSTQTYTIVFATTTLEASASTTGIEVGDWVYVDGDDPREFSYEVATVTSAGVEFYLPYKGNQSGAGLGLEVMPDNPQWNQAAGNFQWVFDNDNFWKVQGIDIRGTDANGQVTIGATFSALGQEFIDSSFTGNNAADYGIYFPTGTFNVIIKKSKIIDNTFGGIGINGGRGNIIMQDIFFKSGSGTSNNISLGSNYIDITLNDYFCQTNSTNLIASSYAGVVGIIKLINSNCSGNVTMGTFGIPDVVYVFEDDLSIIGDNKRMISLATANNTFHIFSTSTTIRAGGGATSLELRPTTNFGTQWDFSKVQLFEYPIYADTTSKQYDMYFSVATDTDFGINPTASELWIECEYWGHATNNYRKITKSTGTFNASSTAWQALSVTCQPSQAGVLYLRGFYAKTLETGESNIIFMDVAPVIN